MGVVIDGIWRDEELPQETGTQKSPPMPRHLVVIGESPRIPDRDTQLAGRQSELKAAPAALQSSRTLTPLG